MGKPAGFLEFEQKRNTAIEPKDRIKNFKEFHAPMAADERRKQAARCMNCGVPFCQSGMTIAGMTSGCPLNNLIPEWNDLLFSGNLEQAYQRLHRTSNFPEFTSRVCPGLCEAACTCNVNGDPVTTKDNEFEIIETAFAKGYVKPEIPKVRTGKKVAVIGSGPSGLATADLLNRRGHSVTVYERFDRVGGLMMYGIPNMKLEKNIIERRINIMKAEGITFVTNSDVGNTVKGKQLLSEYDSIVLCCGASNPRDIKAVGRESKGIYFAVDYLRSVTKALLDQGTTTVAEVKSFPISAKGKNVLVIGGGDTGNDCCGSSMRQGAKSVLQLEMMPEPPETRAPNNPWPQWPKVKKTDYGQEEVISAFGKDPRVYQTTVKEFIAGKDGNVAKAKLVKLQSKFDPETKRFSMVEVEGSEYTVPCELVLIAAGFLGAQAYVAESFGVNLNQRTNVATEAGKYETNVEKVFTAGDMHTGQSLVVKAIREGQEVAKAVDKKLMGYSNLLR